MTMPGFIAMVIIVWLLASPDGADAAKEIAWEVTKVLGGAIAGIAVLFAVLIAVANKVSKGRDGTL
jgi:hypothetical protein